MSETTRNPLELPCAPLPRLSDGQRREVREVALAANARYIIEFIDEYHICPYSRPNRVANLENREVFFAESADLTALFELGTRIAERTDVIVSQVIFPLCDVEARDWIEFALAVTREVHLRRGGFDILGCVPCHPALPYSAKNDYTYAPLYRRAPDPTIQWVRLDEVAKIYAGREGDKKFIDLDLLEFPLVDVPTRPPLYDQFAARARASVERHGAERFEQLLAGISASAQAEYQRVLKGESPT